MGRVSPAKLPRSVEYGQALAIGYRRPHEADAVEFHSCPVCMSMKGEQCTDTAGGPLWDQHGGKAWLGIHQKRSPDAAAGR